MRRRDPWRGRASRDDSARRNRRRRDRPTCMRGSLYEMTSAAPGGALRTARRTRRSRPRAPRGREAMHSPTDLRSALVTLSAPRRRRIWNRETPRAETHPCSRSSLSLRGISARDLLYAGDGSLRRPVCPTPGRESVMTRERSGVSAWLRPSEGFRRLRSISSAVPGPQSAGRVQLKT
jgi:hypothetical protein